MSTHHAIPDQHVVAKAIGAALGDRRRRAGITQYQAAERLGIKQNRVSDHETGAVLPTIPMLIDYSDVYACRVGDLLDGIC